MKIRNLQVKNFRSLKDTEIPLTDCTTLIGRNNNGKSNIMRAIRVLLEGGRSDLKDTDYWERGAPIEISATLEGATKYLPLSDERHRKKIESYIIDDCLRIKKFYGCADKDAGKLYLIDPESNEPTLPTGIDAGIKQILPEIIFVESLADATDEAGTKSSSAMGKILARVLDAIGTEAEPVLTEAFARVNSLLNISNGKDERIAEIRDIETSITSHIQRNFRDCKAVVRVNMPTLQDIFGGLSIDLDDGRQTPFYQKGQGLQRALYLSLLRTLAERVRDKASGKISRPFILMVEEAELFLHPTAQNQMLTALRAISEDGQVVFSTHAPAMVSPRSLDDVILVRKDPISKETRIPSAGGISDEDEKFLLEVTNLERGAKFFFADRVMLVEGKSDACLADAVARHLKIQGYEPDRHAFVEMGGKSNLPRFQEYLQSKGQDTWVLVDLDFLLDDAGKALKSDPDLSKLIEEVEKLVVKTNETWAQPTTAQTKKQKKLAMISELKTNVELKPLKDKILAKLRNKRIFVLRDGDIEGYVGLTESSKGKYIQAALEIVKGSKPIQSAEELKDILDSFVNG